MQGRPAEWRESLLPRSRFRRSPAKFPTTCDGSGIRIGRGTLVGIREQLRKLLFSFSVLVTPPSRSSINGRIHSDRDEPKVLSRGRRYRFAFNNRTSEAHPLHLQSFTPSNWSGSAQKQPRGSKDVITLQPYQTAQSYSVSLRAFSVSSSILRSLSIAMRPGNLLLRRQIQSPLWPPK